MDNTPGDKLGVWRDMRLADALVNYYILYIFLLTYLLMSFLLINIYGSSVENHVHITWCELNFLLGLECYILK